jgi:GWxTD domain-containing protein
VKSFVRFRIAAIAVALACRSALLTGQTLQKPAFYRLRDSLAGTSDTAALRTLFRSLRPDDPLGAGVVALRLGELSADPDYSDALRSFRRAAERGPSRPEPWFGMGLGEAGRSRWEMRDRLRLGSRVGLKTLERSANNYTRALEIDPGFIPAALALARVEMVLLDTARLAAARTVLRRVASGAAPASPELLLALGRVERASGSLDSAVAAFERYQAIGPNRAVGLLELARTRLALGRAEGDAAYYEGAAMDDLDAIVGYRADLRLVAADSVIWQFDRLKGQARAAYLHRFWTGRDHLELRPEGERLREHYRRLLFARLHFPLSVSRRFYGSRDAYRSGNLEVDDRGVIYIRQGEPAERLRPFVFGAMPNESWHYVRAEGDLLFHFSSGYDGNGGGDLYDYRLVQSVLDLHGAADAPRDQLILSRQSLSPIYGRMLNWGRFGSARAQSWERSVGATSIAVGTTTDSYELQFAHRLAAVADLVAVGRGESGNLAHFVFGILGPVPPDARTGSEEKYPIRIRLVALDGEDRSIATLDTTVVIRHRRQLGKNEWLVGRAELTLPVGRWGYRASLQQGDSAGLVLPRDWVRVDNADGSFLALSDLALGSPGRAVAWITDAGDRVLLAPTARFRRGAEAELYYEVRGARADLTYRHEITVFRPGKAPSDRRRSLVAVSFDEKAQSTIIRSHRTVRLDRLKEGSYLMEVKVTAPDGSSRVRLRSLQVIGD